MRFNPYRPQGTTPPGMFRGREAELNHIERFLFQTKNENPQHFIIEGERGIGKSSLMLFVSYLAKGHISFSKIDPFKFLVCSIELNSTVDYLQIIRMIAQELKVAVSENERIKSRAKKAWDFLSKWEILGVRYHKDNHQPDTYQELGNLATLLAEITEDAKHDMDGVLILVDEADKPDSSAGLGELSKLLTEMLVKKGCNRVCIGFAGLPIIQSRLKASHESSPRIFTTLSLKPLSKQESLDVIDAGLKEANSRNSERTTIDESAKNLISDLSEGYPYFLQQFSYSAFEADTDFVISEEDVSSGAYHENGAIDQLGTKFFKELYYDRIDSDNYRIVLNVMAEESEGWIKRQDIITKSGIGKINVTNALKALKERNIIQASEAKKGEYRLPTRAFAAWIKALDKRAKSN